MLAVLVLTGCGDQTSPPVDEPTAEPPAPVTISVEAMVTGLETPWAVEFAPDGRIFITERAGRVRIVKDGKLLNEPWISLEASEGGESGLLGLALDPGFEKNGFVYLAYSYRDENNNLLNRLIRLVDDPATDRGRPDIVLLDGIRGAANHDGGRVKFGPDGKLYWTMGDAGNQELSQDLDSLNGKILRLNRDGTIPDDNPFSGSPVYSYGHRNPQGLAWQPETGRLYATEHGPSGFQGAGQDEVNYIRPGNNYGWPDITGSETGEDLISPVIQSGSSETWAPGGAVFVVSGPWDGSLIFTGLRGQSLYRLTLDHDDPAGTIGFERLLVNEYGRLRDVIQGPDGAIYVLTSNRDGRVRPDETDDKLLRITVR